MEAYLHDPQAIVYALGTLGLLVALIAFARLKSRRPAAEARDRRDAEIAARNRATSIAPAPFREATPLTPVAKPQTQWWSALAKTRTLFSFGASADLDQLKDRFEEACLVSDLGVSNTQEALGAVHWQDLRDIPASDREGAARLALRRTIEPWLASAGAEDLEWPRKNPAGPCVIWFVGVNGVGKTTSIAKLASELKQRGHSVLLAAGDTFRAAAGEQLETWAKRLEIPCVRGAENADSSAVLFDAIESAKVKGIDFVLCDSAGRLHNHNQLMDGLKKNKRVMDKALSGAPHEVLLVLDANTGQNMVNQAEQFLKDVAVTGLVLTKLDGTARGGAVVAVARKTSLPIRRLGLGETADAFRSFNRHEFVEALLGDAEA